jgi:hypothetical protein
MAANLTRAKVNGAGGRLNYRYEGIIDFMLANPEMKRGEIAEELGYTQAWFSSLTHSDAFINRYAERRQELEEELMGRHVARLHTLAEKSAKRVEEALEPDDEREVDPRFALDVHSKVLSNLGFGPKPNGGQGGTGPSTVNTTVNVVTQEKLSEARRRVEFVAKQELEGANEQKALPAEIPES